jgi:hypothetical protein
MHRVRLLSELFRVALGFAPCRKGIERFVSHLPIFVNIPAEAIGIPDIFYDIGLKYGALCHGRIMGQWRPSSHTILSCDNQTGQLINPLIKNNKCTRCEHY